MIHESAIIDKRSDISSSVSIGPYTVIGRNVKIGKNTIIYNNVTIEENTTIGEGCKIWPYSSIGATPQDLSYMGEETFLEIGNNTMIRECVTISRGTLKDNGITKIGSDVLIMAGAHVGHDCKIGNHVVIANYSGITGHVTIDDHVIVGGLSGAHQFVHIGEGSIISGGSMISQDIFPFTNAQGDRACIRGLNLIGLQRRNFSDDLISLIKKAYKLYFISDLSHDDSLEAISKLYDENPVRELEVICNFIKTSKRGMARTPKEAK